MTKDTFEVAKVEVGRMWVYQFVYELDKNHRADAAGSVTEGTRTEELFYGWSVLKYVYYHYNYIAIIMIIKNLFIVFLYFFRKHT